MSKLLSKKTSEAVCKKGGNLNATGKRGRAKYGYYKGIRCDSSYELAFVLYCIHNDIEFFRNRKGFPYSINNENHKYYPDFIVNGTYIEIKN